MPAGEQQLITDYMSVHRAMEEKKKEMDVLKEHHATLEQSIIAMMKKYQRNSIVVGDDQLFLRFERKEKNASKDARKAAVLALCNNNMQNATRLWEAAHMKSGEYDTIETLDLMTKQPMWQAAAISDFK